MQANQQRLLPPENNNRYQIESSVIGEDDGIQPRELSGDENDPQKLNMGSNYTQYQQSKGKANFTLTVATIIKSTIGTGIISLPYSVGQLGLVLGILILLVAAALNLFGSRLLLKAKNLSRHSNYSTIFFVIWENKMAKAIGSFVIFLYNIGTCMIMMIVFKEVVQNIYEEMNDPKYQYLNNQYVIVAGMALVQIPFAFVKKIEKLKIIAFFGAIGVFVFTMSFLVLFISNPQKRQDCPHVEFNFAPSDFYKAMAVIPNIVFAFAFQMNFFPIFKGMKEVNDRKIQKAVFAGNLFCTLVYLLVGILGYIYYYRSKLDVNFLLSMEYDENTKVYFWLINFGFLFSVCCAFPLVFFGCRNNFIAIIDLIKSRNSQSRSSQNSQIPIIETSQVRNQVLERIQNKRKRRILKFRISTIAVFLIISCAGRYIPKAQKVFNITGALSAFPIVILLPCFFYWKLVQMRNVRKTLKYYFAFALLVIILPISIFTIIALFLRDDETTTCSLYQFN